MKNLIKHNITKYLPNIYMGRATSKEKVSTLIEKLHPFRTNKELIRLGPNGDGGYLVPNDLKGIKACFSPGVDKVSEFELACLNYGMEIFMADKSVDSVNLDIPPDRYNFIKKFIGCTNNEDFITMDEWVQTSLPNDDSSDLLLQMDIEGAEYESIINISDSLMHRFRIMVFEFHAFDKIWQPEFFHFINITFEKILQTHLCVHIHPNNYYGICTRYGIPIPRIAEFTFLRKDRAIFNEYETKFPNALDYDNTLNEHIKLPKNWYKC
jgi:hypothetical protein